MATLKFGPVFDLDPKRWVLATVLLAVWPGLMGGLQAATPPERLHYPNQAKGLSGNWEVTQDKGQLGVVIPVATVPGAIPIQVAYRFNASFMQQDSTYRLLKVNVKTDVESWGSNTARLDFPISGSLHFGFISPLLGWNPPDKGEYGRNPSWNEEASIWTLEDGTTFTSGDISGTLVLSPGLYSAFGLGTITSAVNLDSTGSVAFYKASAANLGSWQTTVANLTTSPMFSEPSEMGPVDYQIVMDKDKARIFAFSYPFNCWVPLIWFDRFGHSVTFKWGHNYSNTGGYDAICYVTVLNNLGKGVQAQWASTTSQTISPLLRVDFIGLQAPTLQVSGYSGTPVNQPAGMGGGASFMVGRDNTLNPLRPTEVRLGNPAGDIPIPPWMSAGLAQPSNSAFTESWPADRVWTFTYDSLQAELATMVDPLGVSTAFQWVTTNLYSIAYATTNLYRSVASTVSTDARTGVVLTRTYTWNLPSTSTGTWSTSRTQSYSGTGVISAATPATTTTYTFAPVTDPNYNNAAISNVAVTSGSTTVSNTAI